MTDTDQRIFRLIDRGFVTADDIARVMADRDGSFDRFDEYRERAEILLARE